MGARTWATTRGEGSGEVFVGVELEDEGVGREGGELGGL